MDAHKPGAATGPATRAAKVAALTRLIARCPERLLITVRTTDGEELAEYDLPAADGQPRGPAKAPGEPEADGEGSAPHVVHKRDPKGLWDVRRSLADADPARLTLRQLLDALKLEGLEWSERQVSRWLADLAERGEVDNKKNDADRGTGYGFCY
jgi:hypothetical protein